MRVAIFANIIRILTMFIKTIFKDPKKLKELKIMYQMQSISVFFDIGNMLKSAVIKRGIT